MLDAPRVNLKIFNDLWAASDRDPVAQAEFWNRRARSYDAHSCEGGEDLRALMAAVAAKAGLNADSLVLDIGCGPGWPALQLAPLAARLEGFDISPGMIERARLNTAGLDNVNFQVLDWAAADLRRLGWEKKFHLVMASKTPAVNDRAALEKMMSASRGSCCFIAKVDIRHSVIDQLKPLLGWDAETARSRHSLFCVFNLLWLMGYCPEVEYFDRAWASDTSLEEALLMYTNYFEMALPLTPEQKKALADKLDGLSRGGQVHEEVESKSAMLFWRTA
jgi:SAM-dependent methyltransferase